MYMECIRNFKNIIIIRNNVYKMYKEFLKQSLWNYNNQYTTVYMVRIENACSIYKKLIYIKNWYTECI